MEIQCDFTFHVMGKGIIVKVSVENVMCLFKTKEPSDEGWFFELK
jgi:hypothetical protein